MVNTQKYMNKTKIMHNSYIHKWQQKKTTVPSESIVQIFHQLCKLWDHHKYPDFMKCTRLDMSRDDMDHLIKTAIIRQYEQRFRNDEFFRIPGRDN